MGLKNPFKLEKLTISAYEDVKREIQVEKSPFIAMFNPESYSKKYAIEYGKEKGSFKEHTVNYATNTPPSLSFKLLLDGTGSQEVGVLKDKNQSVADRIKHLIDISFEVNGKIHEPNYLEVSWGGGLKLPCRLSSIDINYTSFNPDGTPLRAELTLELLSDEEVQKRMAREDKQSPDITHSRIVKCGDTLPLLCKAVYGSTDQYLWIAEQNQLDDFRDLNPGQRLFFPPLLS
jgi:hypothetical protein